MSPAFFTGGGKAPILNCACVLNSEISQRAGRIDRGAAEREEVLAVRIGLRLEAVAEIGLPLGELVEGLDPGGVGQLLLAR